MGETPHGIEHNYNPILTVARPIIEYATCVDHGCVEEHTLVAPKWPCEENKCVKCNGVELDTIGEQNHRSEYAIGKACSLSGRSLAFVFEKVR